MGGDRASAIASASIAVGRAAGVGEQTPAPMSISRSQFFRRSSLVSLGIVFKKGAISVKDAGESCPSYVWASISSSWAGLRKTGGVSSMIIHSSSVDDRGELLG